jgi:hypothetical protein
VNRPNAKRPPGLVENCGGIVTTTYTKLHSLVPSRIAATAVAAVRIQPATLLFVPKTSVAVAAWLVLLLLSLSVEYCWLTSIFFCSPFFLYFFVFSPFLLIHASSNPSCLLLLLYLLLCLPQTSASLSWLRMMHGCIMTKEMNLVRVVIVGTMLLLLLLLLLTMTMQIMMMQLIAIDNGWSSNKKISVWDVDAV